MIDKNEGVAYLHGAPGGPRELLLFGGESLVGRGIAYAPDRSACASDLPFHDYVDKLALDIAGRVDGPIRLVGFSMGTFIALHVTERLGDRISRIDLVSAAAPLSWIARGWRDFVRTPVPSLLHGLIAALGGTLVLAVAHQRFYLVSGAFSGFVLVAPVLVTGLYELSRVLARGERPTLQHAVAAWQRSGSSRTSGRSGKGLRPRTIPTCSIWRASSTSTPTILH